MSPIERLRRIVRNPTPIHPGHVYRDQITNERVLVHSVGRHIEVERMDADRRPSNKVPKNVFRTAVEHEIVQHHPRECSECHDDRHV